MIELTVNGRVHQVDADPDTPLLYVLRGPLGLNGAKFGCGLGSAAPAR
jgi:nicotinate dehydrogenase subunit A